MSIALQTLVWDGYPGNSTEKLVFLAVADIAGDDGRFFATPEQVAEKCVMPFSRVIEALRALVHSAWIEDEDLGRYRISVERLQSQRGSR